MAETAEKKLIDVPLYTPLDVARYLRAPGWLVIWAWRGRVPHPVMGPLFLEADGDLPDFLEIRERWSFRQTADLYVRLFAVETLIGLAREDRDRAEVLSQAAWSVFQRDLPGSVFFGTGRSAKDGIGRVVEVCGNRLTEQERIALEKNLLLCLGRFDMAGTDPERLYPFSRVPVAGSPRVVVMDPAIRFGRPTVAGHGTPTDMLFERHQAGDSIAELADDYGLSAQEVEEAIRYEAKPLPLFPFFCW